MKNIFKILPLIVFSIFLLGVASAMTVSGFFSGGAQSLTITNGQNAVLSAQFVSMSLPMNIKIGLYQNGNLLSAILPVQTISDSNTYHNTFTITPDTYNHAVGTYQVVISGTDQMNTNTYPPLTLIVNPAPLPPVNHAPVITSTPLTTVNEGASYTYHVTATDADGDSLTYSMTSTASWLSMNSATHIISGTAPQVTADTPYTVNVQVSDGHTSVSQSYTLTVKNIVPVPDTTAPVIHLLGNNPLIITKGNAYVEYGATVTDNVDTNLVAVTDSSAVNTNVIGTYTVTYNAVDHAGNHAVQVTRTVQVICSNPPPVHDLNVDITSPTDGGTYSSKITKLQFYLTDNDDDVSYCYYQKGNGAEVGFSCDTGYNTVSITSQTGTNEWTIYAEDDAGNTASDSVTFTVTNNNNDNNTETVKTIDDPAGAAAYAAQFTKKVYTTTVTNTSSGSPTKTSLIIAIVSMFMGILIILIALVALLFGNNIKQTYYQPTSKTTNERYY